MPRLLLALLALALVLLLLAWFHVIPGGWRLRNLVEDPADREQRLNAEHRRERLESFARAETEVAAGTILFIGSSTIERFPLSASFPGKVVLNRGIGGESARAMAERLEQSLPRAGREGLAGAVVYAATIDHRKERTSVAEAVARLASLVGRLRELTRPDLPILLLGPLPGNEDDDRYRGPGLEALEEGYRALAGRLQLDFLPLARPPFRSADGGLAQELAADAWHLSPEGYRRLAELIRAEGGRIGELLR